MSGTSMDTPFTIASLPQTAGNGSGQVNAQPVFGLRGSKKRKRHEVAVGIDGEGVNIYNIQSHSLVSSYPIPPQTHFCCAPRSIHLRPTSSSAAQRKTFVITRNGRESERRYLACFTETIQGKGALDEDFAGPKKSELALDNGDVANFELITGMSGFQGVMIFYKDGRLTTVEAGKSDVHRHQLTRVSGSDEEELVEYATVCDADSARKGLLKSREDVIAQLDLMPNSNACLMCRIVQSQDTRRLELYTVRMPGQGAIQMAHPAVQLLMANDLPSQLQKTGSAQYELHAASGTLYQLQNNKLAVCDMSGTIPKLSTRLGSPSVPVLSFVRISASTILTISTELATIYETRYGSVLTSVSLGNESTASTSADKQTKKRKRDDESPDTCAFKAISSFLDIRTVVGLTSDRPSRLIALQLHDGTQGNKRSRVQGTLLADVLGNGDFKKLQTHERDSKASKFEKWRVQIDQLIEQDDVEGLELMVASDEKLGRSKSSDQVDSKVLLETDLWPIPEAFNPQDMDRRKVLYLMSQMFTATKEPERLEVRYHSGSLLEWLALTGFLTSRYVQKALRANVSSVASGQADCIVRPGDILAAVYRLEPDFQLVNILLGLPVHWDVAEVVQAIRTVILSFDTPIAEKPPLALPAPHETNRASHLSDDDEAESDFALESKVAAKELAHASDALSNGLETRSRTLRSAIRRLHTFPASAITSTMRDLMAHKEMIFFIHLLRVELAEGGWTSKYVDDSAEAEEDVEEGMVNTMGGAEESGSSAHAIRAIGDLMNCAIDAIGISGWLVGLSGNATGTEELIDNLRAEVSAGLEGCYEAETLTTFLRELDQGAVGKAKKNYEDEDVQGALPLGGTGRALKGGPKGWLAKARERNGRVGKYAFETIRV